MILTPNIIIPIPGPWWIRSFRETRRRRSGSRQCVFLRLWTGYGLSRVDFFVKEDGEVVFNEINTMPGFTAISMYPMLWEARGVGKEKLVDDLLEHALKRYER